MASGWHVFHTFRCFGENGYGTRSDGGFVWNDDGRQNSQGLRLRMAQKRKQRFFRKINGIDLM